MEVYSQYVKKNHNAGPKAKVDVETIIRNTFNGKINTLEIKNNKNVFYILEKIFFKIKSLFIKDILIIQLPFAYKLHITNKKGLLIGVIHDIEGLRHSKKELLNTELHYYNEFDYLIVHNCKMKNFLIENGVKAKLIELELFDYLVDTTIENNKEFSKQIVYAGNLNKEKAPFIYELYDKDMNFTLNLYGNKPCMEDSSKKIYMGSYPPDLLPKKIVGNLGLVWDGGLISSADKNLDSKNYTKYNNPHKLSCYIAAGLPVIVWKESAIAKFVKENDIGYLIEDLLDINDIDFSDFSRKQNNVSKIQKKVVTGYYFEKALNEILKKER